VRSTQARFASAFLDARLIEWLMSQPLDVGFEIREDTLLVFRRRATASIDDVATALATHDALRARIPRVVLGEPI
jgi:hypothetical protein